MKIIFTQTVYLKRFVSEASRGLIMALFLCLGPIVLAQSTNPPAGYCTTSHPNMGNNGCVNNYGFNFLKVGLDAWTHNVTCNTATVYRYWNNLGSVTTLSQGATYTITIQTASTTYPTSGAAFIDWNGDGTFSNTEYIGTNSTGTSAPTFTKSFTVPCNAVPGQTIMRFRCDYYSAVNQNNGCGGVTNNYGETMDYIITIAGSSSPTANFAVPDTIYTGAPMQFVNSNQSGYVSHEWDIINQGNNPDATTTNFNTTFNTAGTYQVRLTSVNCNGSAVVTKTVTVVDPTSTPVPNFVSSDNVVYFTGDPVEIELYDLSMYGATAWEWTITPDVNNGAPWFWSGGNQFSQNPKAFFYDFGTYEVCLTVTNSMGTSAPLCRGMYIDITQPTGANYVNTMGIDIKSTLDSGLIYDTGGPNGNYGSNEYYEFTIAPCGASSVTLDFSSLNILSGDMLYIYNAPTSGGTPIAQVSGVTLPGSITASSGTMTLLMTTNASGVESGFAASWMASVPQNGAISADFDLPDTLWECSGGTDLVLKNATSGIVPGQATYDWIIGYDPNVTYPAMYCDYCDEENPEWNVPASGQYAEYYIRMVAKSCEGNDTVVKLLKVAPTVATPEIDFTVSSRRISANGIVTLTDITVGGCSYEWNITPASGWALESGYSLTDRIIEVKFTDAGSYHVELEVTNDNGTAVETRTNYIDVIDYCTPSVAIPSIADVGINHVIIENIDNETGSGMAPGFFNYTDDFAVNLTAGETYQLQVKRNSTVNAMTRKAWIDFNRDGEFQDPAERIMLESNANTLSYTATFTVPNYTYTVPGESRLRIGASLGANSFNSCGPIQVGEFEDYGVMLNYDELPPVITLNGSNSIKLEVNTTYTEEGAVAIDNIEGDISGRIVITNLVDMSQPGVYYVHYDVTDASGLHAVRVSRTVTVSTDLTEPVITLIGGTPYIHSVLTPFVDPGYTALDNPGNKNVSGDVVVTGSVDVNVIGDYNLVYTVDDVNGNSTSVTRIVQVRDIDAPVINSATQVFWQVGTPFINPISITDNFDQNVQVTMTGNMNVNVLGTYTVKFEAVDFSGNVATPVTVTFEVGDAIAPMISTLAGSDVLVVEVNDADFFEPPVTATDNFYPSVNLVRNATALNIYELGSYPIVYTATDGSGNTATYTRTIVVVDTERPTVIAAPLNIQRWSGTFDPMVGVSALDNYWTPQWFDSNPGSIEVVLSNVDVNYPGIYTVMYRATDGSGNVSALTSRSVLVWTPTALEGVDLGSMVQVYPNPSNGIFTVKLDAQLGNKISVQIVDALGKSVYLAGEDAFVNGETVIDLSLMNAGVYFVQISTEHGSVSKRVIVNK